MVFADVVKPGCGTLCAFTLYIWWLCYEPITLFLLIRRKTCYGEVLMLQDTIMNITVNSSFCQN